MKKLEKIYPIAFPVTGRRVVISEKVFSEILNVINAQTEAINALIDNQQEANESINKLDTSLKSLANAIDKL